MIPEKLYRDLKNGSSESHKVLMIVFSVPEIPKKDTKPKAISKAGMHKGTEERESRKDFPKKFLFAVKNVAEMPIKSASTVEQIA